MAVENNEIITLLDQRFSALDQQFSTIDKRFSTLEEKIDEKFSRVDERFSNMDERFSNMDENFSNMDTRFRELKMKSERLEGEIMLLRNSMQLNRSGLEQLKDELTLPSGSVALRFAELDEKIENRIRQTHVLVEEMNGKIKAVGEDVDRVRGKLDSLDAKFDVFSDDTVERLTTLEATRR